MLLIKSFFSRPRENLARTLFWSFLLTITLSFVSVFSGSHSFGESQAGGAIIYPVSPVFQFGFFKASTSQALAIVFSDRLKADPRYKASEVAAQFYRLSVQYRLDPAFVLSLIDVESGFRSDVVSSAGAVGLLQLMPDTARYLSKRYKLPYHGPRSLTNPMINLALGMAYVRELKDRYKGLDDYFHLAAFNMGPARLDELRARPGFKPDQTLKYYHSIMKGVSRYRYYGVNRLEPKTRGTRVVVKDLGSKERGFERSSRPVSKPKTIDLALKMDQA